MKMLQSGNRRNARISESDAVLIRNHYPCASSNRLCLFFLNIILLFGSKLIYADQHGASVDHPDDACSSGQDASDAHNCPIVDEVLIDEDSIEKPLVSAKDVAHADLGFGIAWWMAFPNPWTGSKDTLAIISNTSNISAATNYANAAKGQFVSIHEEGSLAGPFWIADSGLEKPANGLILTETHCGNANYSQWNFSASEFRKECLKYRTAAILTNNNDVHYDIDLVKKIVFFMRDPFDIVASRFHAYERKSLKENRQTYGFDASGFRAFCVDKVDQLSWDQDLASFVDRKLWDSIQKVPCGTEFLRHIFWQNQVFQLIEETKLPSMMVNYETYGTSRWDETVTALLSFIGRPVKRHDGNMLMKKYRYRHFYSFMDVDDVRTLYKTLATQETWMHVQHYFETVPVCTFESLHAAFYEGKGRNDGEDHQQCWNPEDEILRIPSEAIVNRDNMQMLGRGSNGVVYKAHVDLKGGDMCSVAIKTDKCMHMETNQKYLSCIHPNTVKMQVSENSSSIQSEYLGALLFASSKKAGVDLPGILPTWGVLYNSTRQFSPGDMNNTVGRSLSKGLIGIVMPIVEEFKTIKDIITVPNTNEKKIPLEVAKLMLPVTEALAFVDGMGLSFQDVRTGNFGLESGHRAFIFDNTYLSFLEGGSCSFEGRLKNACNFCMKDAFPPQHRQAGFTREMVRRKDCDSLIMSIMEIGGEFYLWGNYAEDDLFSVLDYILFSGDECKIDNVAEVLRSFIARNSPTIKASSNVDRGIDIPFRVYEPWVHPFPCYPSDTQTNQGFFYAKIPKTAGTTVAGVARHIVNHKGREMNFSCNIRTGHGSPRTVFDYDKRDLAKSFLWSFIREPAARTLSSFFYHAVSKGGVEPSDDRFIKWAKKSKQGQNYQSNFLRIRDFDTTTDNASSIQDILDSYDFIGITERMDESLVIVMMLLELNIEDILYMSSKQSDYAFTSDSDGNLQCVHVHPKFRSPTMNQFFSSSEWKNANEDDILLYRAANHSLDLTIQRLGRSNFEANLHTFRHILQRVQKHCEASTIYPCSSDGILNDKNSNCYIKDEGCGYECLDDFAPTMKISEIMNSKTKLDYHSGPDIVWLMAFPKSGTRYTLQLLRSTSTVSGSTNYGGETKKQLASIYQGSSSGPFWIPDRGFDRPTNGSVVTKTHCGSSSLSSPKGVSIPTQAEFLKECRRYEYESSSKNDMYYDKDLIKKVVHLIRDPLDSIASHFRHARKMKGSTYEDNLQGFRNYCSDKVDSFSNDRDLAYVVGDKIWNVIKGVPCHTSFLRYIYWHNHAFQVANETKMPSLIVYFERYDSHWNETATELLDFLERHMKGNVPAKFIGRETYRRFYEVGDVDAVRTVYNALATEETWLSIQHYFELGMTQSKISTAGSAKEAPTNATFKSPAVEKPSKFVGTLHCSYESLHAAFHKENGSSRKRNSHECWRLEDDILRIPAKSIVNLDNMERLMKLNNGMIHKAAVELSTGGDICYVAIKTNKCRNDETKEKHISCIHPNAVEMEKVDESYMKSEYMGALLFASSQKSGIDLPGILPRWGIVDAVGDNNVTVDDSLRRGTVFTGVVIPLEQDFKPMDIWIDLSSAKKTPLEVARLMLPVAEALTFVQEMGMSFQDTAKQNIGIDSSHSAFIFDNKYLSFLEGGSCSLHGKGDDACNFCMEDAFRHQHRQVGYTRDMVYRKDCHKFIQLISTVIKSGKHSGDEYKDFDLIFRELDDMKYRNGCQMDGVARVLKSYIDGKVPGQRLNMGSHIQ